MTDSEKNTEEVLNSPPPSATGDASRVVNSDASPRVAMLEAAHKAMGELSYTMAEWLRSENESDWYEKVAAANGLPSIEKWRRLTQDFHIATRASDQQGNSPATTQAGEAVPHEESSPVTSDLQGPWEEGNPITVWNADGTPSILVLDLGGSLIANAAHAQGLSEGQKGLGWQTIDSAPKDGTQVLLYVGGGPMVGFWDGDYWNEPTIGNSLELFVVTHWMPLPNPPSGEEGR